MLCLNLIQLGCGPLDIGRVSDLTLAACGSQSRSIAPYALTPLFLIRALASIGTARVFGRARAISTS